MDLLSVFIQGLTLGLAYLAPIGMQNLFVINSALSHRLGRAMATALVVVFWDVSLALACFFGAGALMDALPWLRSIVLGLGGLLVVCIGVGLIRSEADISCDKDMNQPFAKIILASFVVTWLNPQAIVDGTIMLGAFRATLPPGGDPCFIAGFATASFVWFNTLALVFNRLGSKINVRALTWVNRVCGVMITLYGLKLLSTLVLL
ncbi:LysE/ArgO family amino acid transporter [Senegalimassilia anaerobia]|uniref:LysE/ArgO family amino acid transporter n=1 Tax=Senegalimassilia anaerobia TaxID=1473216 RepID=UPI003A972FCB